MVQRSQNIHSIWGDTQAPSLSNSLYFYKCLKVFPSLRLIDKKQMKLFLLQTSPPTYQTFPFIQDPYPPSSTGSQTQFTNSGNWHLAKSKPSQTKWGLPWPSSLPFLPFREEAIHKPFKNGTALLKRPQELEPPSWVTAWTNHPRAFHLTRKDQSRLFPREGIYSCHTHAHIQTP